MAWETPKTNWNASTDRFNASDFNRLKNNLWYLRTMAIKIYGKAFSLETLGDDRIPGAYFYADEINKIEKNLTTVNANSVKLNIGAQKTYQDNGRTMDAAELNRMERAMRDIYDALFNKSTGFRKFTWNFGTKEDF